MFLASSFYFAFLDIFIQCCQMPNPKIRNFNLKIRNFPDFFLVKSGKLPGRFSKVSFDLLKFILLGETINNAILYLRKIYFNETIENLHRIKTL